MKVEVECRVNVKGRWWDIVTEHEVSDDLSSLYKVAQIKAIIGGLASTGSIVSRVGATSLPTNGQVVTEQTHEQEGTEAAGFTWPIPQCGLHREEMKVSTHQKKEGYSQFFCPLRHGQGYCKHRASVDMANGMPKFWEVK